MLCIIVGVLLGALFYYLSMQEYFVESRELSIMLSIIVFFLGIFIGIFIPSDHQEPVLVNEIELASLDNELMYDIKGNIFYLSVSANNVYTFRYQVNNEYNLTGKSYKVDTLKRNVIEIESSECDKAFLKVYKVKPKITFISFGLGASKTEYVFYVPEGTIQKEVALK